jgi:predicted porin
MNKKLIAVAVAGMFAAPTAALAQSSVTISGLLKGGYESLKIGNYSATRAGNNSQNGVVDDSSRIVFNIVEDLGGGLQAIGQLDMRVKPDDLQGAAATNPSNIVSGNSHFGLRSKDWGRIIIGRQDLHYFNTESNITDKGSLRASSIGILAYIGPTAIAGATRTQNVVHYTTPNWGGFTAILAYSSNPSATEADIASGMRKGYAWNLNPNFAAANWQIGYSYWDARPDATANANQRGDRLYGSYVFPFGLKIGGAYDKAKRTAVGGATANKRNAWSLPASYTWGNHSVHAHYTRAENDKATAADDSAKMWGMAYAYDLSKRTSVALTYAQIKNAANGTYNFFTSNSLGIGGAVSTVAGEDPKMWAVTLRHAF